MFLGQLHGAELPRADFARAAQEYIRAGDAFQVVPSQRFSLPFRLPPLALYRSLRRLNPSPFSFYLNLGDFALVGSSPEILVRLRDGTVTVRPIAGTRPRGATRAEDLLLEQDLLADPKELAEHLMLLDLGRNDVGRVSRVGSVRVTEKMIVELEDPYILICEKSCPTFRRSSHSWKPSFSPPGRC